MKKLNKKFNIFHVIIILCNYHFIILKFFSAIKGFILHQIKQTALRSGYNFTPHGKFTDTNWIEELQTRKPLSTICASSSISRKRQAMDFESLCHKWPDHESAHPGPAVWSPWTTVAHHHHPTQQPTKTGSMTPECHREAPSADTNIIIVTTYNYIDL